MARTKIRGAMSMIKTEQNVNINFKILPFGSIHLEEITKENAEENILKQPVKYIGSETTNQQSFEIIFCDQEYYIVPKTTG
jgi:hypothetical protein